MHDVGLRVGNISQQLVDHQHALFVRHDDKLLFLLLVEAALLNVSLFDTEDYVNDVIMKYV